MQGTGLEPVFFIISFLRHYLNVSHKIIPYAYGASSIPPTPHFGIIWYHKLTNKLPIKQILGKHFLKWIF